MMNPEEAINALVPENFILQTEITPAQLQADEEMIHERNRLIAENSPENVSTVDIHGVFTYVNQKAAKFHGHQIHEMVGKSIFDLLDRETGERYRHDIFLPVIKENREVISDGIFNRNNAVSHLRTHCLPIHNGRAEVIGVLHITHDSTLEHKIASYLSIDQSINLITSYSEGLEKTIQDVFFILCQAECIYAGGLYLFVEERQTLELICQYNLSETFTRQIKSFDTDSQQYQIVSKGIPQYDILSQLPELSQMEILETTRGLVSVIPLVHEKQIVGCLNFLLNDEVQVTEEDKSFIESIAWRIARFIDRQDVQKKLNKTIEELNETICDLKIKQQMLIQKSKMESLGELSAGIAHEINQPLVIISLSIENIMQKMVMGRKHLSVSYMQRKFDSILININRIQQIIENMRIFARDQSSILFSKVNVKELITKTLEMVGVQYRAEGIKIVKSDVDERTHVIGNIYMLEQVLLNLLSNSRYALNEKYNRTDVADFQKQIEIKAVRKGNLLIMDITDNGVGISEEHIEKLFTPFFTTKMEGSGTGLGLPIVYGIVKEMNGDINISSKVDEFTKVRISLPAV